MIYWGYIRYNLHTEDITSVNCKMNSLDRANNKVVGASKSGFDCKVLVHVYKHTCTVVVGQRSKTLAHCKRV